MNKTPEVSLDQGSGKELIVSIKELRKLCDQIPDAELKSKMLALLATIEEKTGTLIMDVMRQTTTAITAAFIHPLPKPPPLHRNEDADPLAYNYMPRGIKKGDLQSLLDEQECDDD